MTVGLHLFTILKNSCLLFCLLLPHDNWDYLGFLIVAFPASIYLFQISNGNTRTMCKILSKVNNKDTRMTSMTSFRYLYCELWTDITHCFGAFIVDFEQVSSSWVNVTTNQKIISKFRKNIRKNIVKKSRIMEKSRLGNYSIIFFQACLKYFIDKYHQGRSRSGKKSIAGSAQLKI